MEFNTIYNFTVASLSCTVYNEIRRTKGDNMFGQPITREQITTAIDALWALHDEAEQHGDIEKADAFSLEAFKLLEMLPENAIYVRVKQ
jgi:hypothetical protein